MCIYRVKMARHTYVYKQTKNDTLLEQVKSSYFTLTTQKQI